jgi:hypothetical protein
VHVEGSARVEVSDQEAVSSLSRLKGVQLGADLGVSKHLEMLSFVQSMQSYEEGKGRGKHHCF